MENNQWENNKRVVLIAWGLFTTIGFGQFVAEPIVGPEWAVVFGGYLSFVYFALTYNDVGTALRASVLGGIGLGVAYAFHAASPGGGVAMVVLLWSVGLLGLAIRRKFLGDKWAANGPVDRS